MYSQMLTLQNASAALLEYIYSTLYLFKCTIVDIYCQHNKVKLCTIYEKQNTESLSHMNQDVTHFTSSRANVSLETSQHYIGKSNDVVVYDMLFKSILS